MEVYCLWALLAVSAVVFWRTMPPSAEMKLLGLCVALASVEALSMANQTPISRGLCALGPAGLGLIALCSRAVVGVATGRQDLPLGRVAALGLVGFCGAGFLVAMGSVVGEEGSGSLWNIFFWERVCGLSLISVTVAAVFFRQAREFDRLLWVVCSSALVTAACIYIGLPKENQAIRAYQDNWWEDNGRLGGAALLAYWPSTPAGPLRLDIVMGAPELGEFALIGLAGSIAYFLGHPRPATRRTAGCFAALLTCVIVLAQARGAIIAAAAAASLSATLTGLHSQSRSRAGVAKRIVTILGVLGILVVWVSVERFRASEAGESLRNRAAAMAKPDQDETFQGRIELWKYALDLGMSKPLGSGFFADFDPTGMRNPHNLYLWLLLGAGWIGAAAFFTALGSICSILGAGLKRAPQELVVVNIAALTVLAALAVAGLTSVLFGRVAHVTCFWLLVGAAVSINLKARQRIAAIPPVARPVLASTGEASGH